jgi:uncharacterized protein YqeY
LPAVVKTGKAKIEGIYRLLFAATDRTFWDQDKSGRAHDLDYDALLDFLEQEGFFMLDINETSMFVRVTDHRLLKELTWKKGVNLTVKRFLKTYTRKTVARPDVWRLCNKTAKLFGNQFLTGLDPLAGEFCRDTGDTVHLFFQNGAVQITAHSVRFLPYEQVKGLVWQENMSPHAYTGKYHLDLHGRLKADLRAAIKTQNARQKRIIRELLHAIDHRRSAPAAGPLDNDGIFGIINELMRGQIAAAEECERCGAEALARAAHLDAYAYEVYWQLYVGQKSEYEQVVEFLANDILDVEEGPEKRKAVTINNLPAYRFGLAHLVIKYNEPSNARCIVLADSNPTLTSNGRRGKKILLEALKYLRGEGCVVKEDGKALSNAQGDRFMYQMIRPNTEIVIIDDVDGEKFNFKGFYSVITDGMVIESKGANNPRWRFSFENNPKICITSNDPVYGDDLSSVDRAILLPVSDHFRRIGKSPRQVFGHTLYEGWEPDEWNRMYDFFIGIIQEYLQRPDPSVIPIVDLTIFNAHKLMLYVPDPMVNYLDTVEAGKDYVYDDVKNDIEAAGVKFRSKHEYTKTLHTYAQLRGYRLKKNTKDGRYISNKVQYLQFVQETPELNGMTHIKPRSTE